MVKHDKKSDKLFDYLLFYIIPSVSSGVAIYLLSRFNNRIIYLLHTYGFSLYINIALLSAALLGFPLVAIPLLLNLFTNVKLPREGARRLDELLSHRLDYLIVKNVFLRLIIIHFIILVLSVSAIITDFTNMFMFALVIVSIIWGIWYLFLAFLVMYWVIKAIYREKP